jgi:hypothetical protein
MAIFMGIGWLLLGIKRAAGELGKKIEGLTSGKYGEKTSISRYCDAS